MFKIRVIFLSFCHEFRRKKRALNASMTTANFIGFICLNYIYHMVSSLGVKKMSCIKIDKHLLLH